MIKLFWNTHNQKELLLTIIILKIKKPIIINGAFIIKKIQIFGFMKF